jgi:(1->4)-alpha-D-glucan 1-alpha-D-glucosylmutase
LPGSYALILTDALAPLEAQLGGEHADVLELHSILTAVRNLPSRTETDPARIAEYHREKEFVKHRLRALLDRSIPARESLAASIRGLSGEVGDPRSFDRLDELIGQQAYRLAHWQVAADEINYRRFFDVNELAAICVEHREVFEQTHRLVFELLARAHHRLADRSSGRAVRSARLPASVAGNAVLAALPCGLERSG